MPYENLLVDTLKVNAAIYMAVLSDPSTLGNAIDHVYDMVLNVVKDGQALGVVCYSEWVYGLFERMVENSILFGNGMDKRETLKLLEKLKYIVRIPVLEYVVAFILVKNISASTETTLYMPISFCQMAWQEASSILGLKIHGLDLEPIASNYLMSSQCLTANGILSSCDELKEKMRSIVSEGRNDENNTNREKKFIMVGMSVLIFDSCLKILCKNGQFTETLRLFYKVVNGLDPPMDLDSAGEVSI